MTKQIEPTGKAMDTDTSQDTIQNAPQPTSKLAATSVRASDPVKTFVTMRKLEAINQNELVSIYALLAWVAHNQNVNQSLVQTIVETELNVQHVANIQRADYQRAVAFLVDLRIDELKN